MNWILTPTQREYDANYRIQEQLRHERLEREASIICPIETTPIHERTPLMTMARLREAKLQQGAQAFRDIWTDDKDERIPDL